MADKKSLADLEKLDKELAGSARYVTVTPYGYLLEGWTKAEAAGVLAALAERLHNESVDSDEFGE